MRASAAGPPSRHFAGQALGAGDLDDLAAARLDLDARPAGHDAAEVEQDGDVAAGRRAHHRLAPFKLQQIVRPRDRVVRRLNQSLFV